MVDMMAVAATTPAENSHHTPDGGITIESAR